MTYTPKNGAKIYITGSKDPVVSFDPGNIPLTMKREQSLGRLHRPGKLDIQHVWIDEASSIDERVFASLARKGAEQEIRAAVTAKWEEEHGKKISRRSPSEEPARGGKARFQGSLP